MNKYEWIKGEEAAYLLPIYLIDGWAWSMRSYLRRSFLYKNSQFETSNDDRDRRPFKNIIRPILNIQYRTEGFDVKDIELYVDSEDKYHYSLLVDKFHNKWALKHQIDTFIDELVESYVDYGGVLTKNVNEERPEVVNLLSLAFCDQTGILSGPFAIKHYFSPSELRKMASAGWGDEKNGATIDLETLIKICEPKKKQDGNKQSNATPGKYVETYEVHGDLPMSWLKEENEEYDNKHVPQIQIIAFYKNPNNQDVGVTLFAAKEPKLPFKFLSRDGVFGRALGFGGIEELFEPQVWTNFGEIQMQEMLELASKTFFKTTDSRFKTRNNLTNSENGQVFDLQQGTDINQLDTAPRSINIFNTAVNLWEQHARALGGAGESLMGESPSAGTPFKLQELVTMEAKGLHHWRQGKIAVFMDEIYRDWVLPYIAKELTKDQSFFAELSMDELQKVTKIIVENKINKAERETMLNGEFMFPEEKEVMKVRMTEEFLKQGNKRLFKIFKDELKDAPLEVLTNIVSKQKNLALLTDKLVNVLRQFIATPAIRQDPEMVKLLNTILESSGMSPIMFSSQASSPQSQQRGGTEPLQALSRTNKETTLTSTK